MLQRPFMAAVKIPVLRFPGYAANSTNSPQLIKAWPTALVGVNVRIGVKTGSIPIWQACPIYTTE